MARSPGRTIVSRNHLHAGAGLGLLVLTSAPLAVAGPLPVRNQHPLATLYGLSSPLPARLPPPGEQGLGASVQWANFAVDGESGDAQFTLDGEVFEARASYQRALGDRYAVRVEAAWRKLDEGSLDGLIEQWHDAFGLPNGPRDRFPDERLLVEYRAGNDAVPLRLQESVSGLTDLPVSVGWQWQASEVAATSAWLTVKAPTGSASDLTGSGATDVAFSLAAERQLSARWQVFGQASIAWLGQGDVLAEWQEDYGWSVLAGITWNPWRGLDLTAQVEANSAVFDTGLDGLDGDATVLTFGGSWRTPARWRLDFAISEDIETEASPDVVLHLGVSRGF